MIPSEDIILPETDDTTVPSDNYRMILKNKTVVGHVDDIEAMKQVIYKILSTERYENIIYSWDYGIELRDLIGEPYDYVCACLEGRIKEALMQDDRIEAVSGFEYERTGKDSLRVTFDVKTVFGDIQSEKDVTI